MNIVNILSSVALVFQVIAVTTGRWSVLNLKNDDSELSGDLDSELTLGLWSVCGNVWGKVDDMSGNVSGCLDLPVDRWSDFPVRSLNVVRVFSILGAIFVLTGLLYSQKCRKWAGASLLFGGLCSLVATSVWYNNFLELQLNVDEENNILLKMDLGYSYFFNLLGSLVALGAGVSLLGKDKGKSKK